MASTVERKLTLSFERKAEAERLLQSAVAETRSALESEIDASTDRLGELASSVAEYDRWESAKRSRAATERELMASLASVASLTPEAEIADKLSVLADAKAELVAVDSALADVFAEAIASLRESENQVQADLVHLESALADLPNSDDSTACREFTWTRVHAAHDVVRAARDRAYAAIDNARRLEAVILQSLDLRTKAVDGVADDDDLPPFKEAAKEVAAAGLETAAAFSDWVLSDGPEILARDVADRLKRANPSLSSRSS